MCIKVRCEWATNRSQADVEYHDIEWGVPINIVFTHDASYAIFLVYFLSVLLGCKYYFQAITVLGNNS
jgi:hypothetical protein